MTFKFDESYREEATLADGTRVILRTVRPEDKELLRRGFERLSPESRFFRFFANKLSLSDSELRRLTEVDGVDHVALGAAVRRDDGVVEGLGIARFVRLDDEPRAAEPAVAVVDDEQGKGLGTLLLQRLAEAAHERGIERFRFEVLASNTRMKRIIEEMSGEAIFAQPVSGVLEMEFPLPRPVDGRLRARDLRKSAMQRMLAHVKRDVVSVGLGRRLLKHLADERDEG
jgi:GNAT superfamily N-acetyltransferase